MAEIRRRILVVVDIDNKRRKLVVTVSEKATVADLATEVLVTIGAGSEARGSLVLEINDGFELRSQDFISIIAINEIVTARRNLDEDMPTDATVKSLSLEDPSSSPPPYDHQREEITNPTAKMFQIKLVDAQLAHNHASQHPGDRTLSIGSLAFGGEWISGNTRLSALTHEAARLFHWKLAELDERDSDCHHEPQVACSCVIALQVKEHGLASMLHCRHRPSGGLCNTSECPYSHEAVEVPLGNPSCLLCSAKISKLFTVYLALARAKSLYQPSLVPTAPVRNTLYVPWYRFVFAASESCHRTLNYMFKNAGCNHLLHEHCITKQSRSASSSQLDACPKCLIPWEMLSFPQSHPYITVVWDGDNIDKIPIPDQYRRNSHNQVELHFASVQSLTEQFLNSKGYILRNLCMKVHQKQPGKNVITFHTSTLVSVCALPGHKDIDGEGFTLFPERNRPNFQQRIRTQRSLHIDFHTSEAPIIACGCTTIGEIFAEPTSATECVTLYVSKRQQAPETQDVRNIEANFVERPEWHPEIKQSRRGISAFLSSLFIMWTIITNQGTSTGNKILAAMYSMCRFPPAIRAMGRLFLNKTLEPWEKSSLSEAMFFTLRAYCETYDVPEVIRNDPQRTFEVARIFLSQLCSVAAEGPSPSTSDSQVIEDVSITCPLTLKRLQEYTLFNGSIIEQGAFNLFAPEGPLFHLHDTIALSPRTWSSSLQPSFRQLLKQSGNCDAPSVDIFLLDALPGFDVSYNLTQPATKLDFSTLIDAANSTAFRVISPLGVDVVNVDSPQLVLDQHGLLAVFTRVVGGVTFLIPTDGEKKIDDVHEVVRAQGPFIKIAKEEHTWEIDSFAAQSSSLDEAVVVCVDLSSSMNRLSQVHDKKGRKSFFTSQYLTRLQLAIKLFNVFVGRACGVDSKISLAIGLITYSGIVRVAQNLTPTIKNFIHALEDSKASGTTPLYDALDKAQELLVDFSSQQPDVRKRIIVISGGEDTWSTILPQAVAARLHASDIVVDSVQVGKETSTALHAISACTGGYRFYPKDTLSDSMSIFELETMLDSSSRPTRKLAITSSIISNFEDFKNKRMYPADEISMDTFPHRAEHLKMGQPVVPVNQVRQHLRSGARLIRIMNEIRAWNAAPHPSIDLYVNEEDITFMKVVIKAPTAASCPYSGGTFLLTCEFPDTYPRSPPEFRFISFILHPNVSKQGKICVAELGRLWTSDMTLKQALSHIHILLLEPDEENSIETRATMKYYEDDGTYAAAAAKAVEKYACQSREQWRMELANKGQFNLGV